MIINFNRNVIRDKLKKLVDFGVLGVKAGTEIEFFGYLEHQILLEVSHNLIPLIVKIGGVDAREDIYNLLVLGVDGVIVPMVETEYALKNFFFGL